MLPWNERTGKGMIFNPSEDPPLEIHEWVRCDFCGLEHVEVVV